MADDNTTPDTTAAENAADTPADAATKGATSENEGADAKSSVSDLADLKDIAGDTPQGDSAEIAQRVQRRQL